MGVLLPTPAPEVLETVLRQRYGPLPRAAAIARLRKQLDGGYQPAGDLAEVLERRQAANAKERERVRGPPKPLYNPLKKTQISGCCCRIVGAHRAAVPIVPRSLGSRLWGGLGFGG